MKPIRLSLISVLKCEKSNFMKTKKSKFWHSDGSLILECALFKNRNSRARAASSIKLCSQLLPSHVGLEVMYTWSWVFHVLIFFKECKYMTCLKYIFHLLCFHSLFYQHYNHYICNYSIFLCIENGSRYTGIKHWNIV